MLCRGFQCAYAFADRPYALLLVVLEAGWRKGICSLSVNLQSHLSVALHENIIILSELRQDSGQWGSQKRTCRIHAELWGFPSRRGFSGGAEEGQTSEGKRMATWSRM